MKQNSEKYRKQMIEVIGSAYEFVLKLGAKARYHGYLRDRSVNNMERWGITELDESGEPVQTIMTHRFDFSVNEEADLREVAKLFIEKLGIKNYRLNINFK
jgi:hypothetical protein